MVAFMCEVWKDEKVVRPHLKHYSINVSSLSEETSGQQPKDTKPIIFTWRSFFVVNKYL